MASQSRWSKLQSRPLEQAVGVVHHLRQEVVALQEVLEGQEEEEVIMVLLVTLGYIFFFYISI